MKTNKYLIILLSVICILSCLAFSACNNNEEGNYSITVAESEYGTVLAQNSANAGDKIKLDVKGLGSFDNYKIFVNGELIEGKEFIMPEGDVVVNVSFLSSSSDAHAVIVEDNQDGQVVPSLSSAVEGQTVSLTAFPTFNREVDYFTLNGQKIVGRTFPMPAEEVTVGAVFKEVFESTGVELSLTVSYMTATSYWYAEYTPTAIVIETVVNDDFLFTAKKADTSAGMADNVEFIIGLKGSEQSLNSNCFKLVINAIGEYYYQHYYGTSFVNTSSYGMGIEFEQCSIFTHGFNGYKTKATIPYSLLGGLTYQQAYGNLVICPAMRNTTNALKTGWTYYRKMNCDWYNPSTHLLIEKDGTFGTNVGEATYLYAGDELMAGLGANHVALILGTSYTHTVNDSTIKYWIENVGDITRYSPEEVFFSCGSNDLEKSTVLSTFKDMREFISVFKANTNAKLTIVSSIPSLISSDYNAVVAYNNMVKEYVATLENVDFIDFCALVYEDGKINMPLYASHNSLSEDGKLLLSKTILEKRGIVVGDVSDVWGSTDSYIATGSWAYANDVLSVSNGSGNIYYKGGAQSDFIFEINLTATKLFNGEAYPKFGFMLVNENHSRAYYISAIDLVEELVGIVEKPVAGFDWTNGTTYSVPGITYSSGNYAKLKLVKLGDSISFYVNGELIATTVAGNFGDDPITLGLFTFNTGLNIKDIRIVSGTEEVQKEVG